MAEKRLTAKELAWELRRSPAYVSYMRRAGFVMIGGMAMVSEAFAFFNLYPDFNCTVARSFPPRRLVKSVNSDAVRGGGRGDTVRVANRNPHQ